MESYNHTRDSFKVKGVEEVLDAFDEWEADNPLTPIEVYGISIDDVIDYI